MTHQPIALRLATLDDSWILHEWRNDQATREASHNTAEVPYEAHRLWLEGVLANPFRRIYIAEMNGERVGTVRLDSIDGGTSMSWTVAPNHRRQGIGSKMVALATGLADGPIYAEIKAHNEASQKIAQRAGLQQQYVQGGVLYFNRLAAVSGF